MQMTLMLKFVVRLIGAIVLVAMLPLVAPAQHPIDVQKLSAKGEHFKALTTYEQLPERRYTTDATVAAARSAWALSLPKIAIDRYENALRDEKLSNVDRARIYLSRGIIEYQEDRFEVAQLYAEKAINLLPDASPLRSKVWFLWGESMFKLGRLGAAEEKLMRALEESPKEDKGDIYFALGNCKLRLGKNEEAQADLEKVPLRHDRTPRAIRLLAQLAIELKSYEQAEFWLAKGRSDYQEHFLDSWVDYALMLIAIEKGERLEVDEVVTQARKQYPPSDPWLTLLEGAYAQYKFQSQQSVNSGDNQ